MAGIARATKIEYELRLKIVLEMLLEGEDVGRIYSFAIKAGWGVGFDQIRKYIEEAQGRTLKALEVDRVKVFSLDLARREELYRKLYAIGEYKDALAVLQDKGKLLKFYDETMRHILEVRAGGQDGEAGDYSVYSDAELEEGIRDVRKFIESQVERGRADKRADKPGAGKTKS